MYTRMALRRGRNLVCGAHTHRWGGHRNYAAGWATSSLRPATPLISLISLISMTRTAEKSRMIVLVQLVRSRLLACSVPTTSRKVHSLAKQPLEEIDEAVDLYVEPELVRLWRRGVEDVGVDFGGQLGGERALHHHRAARALGKHAVAHR